MKIISEIIELDFIKKFLLELQNSRLYLVGGAVRDMLLGIKTADFDLVAENISLEELIKYLKKYGEVIEIEGRSFGVIKFRPKLSAVDCKPSTVFDVALPRREKYLSGMRRKHAEVEVENVTIDDDLARRDFTINAMAINISEYSLQNTVHSKIGITKEELSTVNRELLTSSLIDPFDGQNDLKDKLIRAVGDPKDRFQEDPTRILRGIRFAVRFGFTIEPETKKAMKELAPEILRKFELRDSVEAERVPWEVIGGEFIKTFENNTVRTIKLYDEIGLLELLFPEIEAMKGVLQPENFHSEGDVFTHTLIALEKLPDDAAITLKLATLLHDIGKPPTFQSKEETGDRIRFNNHDHIGAELSGIVLHRLRLPNKIIDDVSWLIKNHMKLLFAFPEMRRDKKKNFARDPRFKELIKLATADASATIPQNGKPDLGFIEPVQKILNEIEQEEKEGKPRQIINGDEIIALLKKKNPAFDLKKEGKTVGKLKIEINSLYDRGEISSKIEALEIVKKSK